MRSARAVSRIAVSLALITVMFLSGGMPSALSQHLQSNAGAAIRVGFVLPDLANPFIAGIRDGAVAAAKTAGITLLVKGTNDAAGQTNALLNYVAAGVNVVAVDAIDGDAIAPAVKAANKANIPVIAIQAQPRSGQVATFIAADNKLGGTLIGQAVAEYCAGKNPCKVGIVEGDLADQSGRDENSGMRGAVAKHANIQIVGAQPTNYDPEKALNVATNLLTAHPDLNYIYSWWDQGALAALQAAKSKGLAGKIGISGFGGNCLNLAEVIKGNIYSETMFFPQYMGSLMIQKAQAALKGQKLPAITPAPIIEVTTPLAKAWLAGTAKPPAALSTAIMQKLTAAQAGKCSK